MDPSRRTIRKVEIKRLLDVEDQLWPIVVTLLVLAAFVAGLIIASPAFTFRSLNPLLNTATWLATLLATCGGIVYAAVHYQGRQLRRGMLIGLLTILVHLWIAMMVGAYNVFYIRRENEPDDERMPSEQVVRLPDYFVMEAPQNIAQQEFERPVETEIPEVPEPEIEREDVSSPEARIEPLPSVDRELQETPPDRPQPIERERPEETAPKPRPAPNKMSRQTRPVNDTPDRVTDIPKPPTSPQRAPTAMQAPTTPNARRTPSPSKTASTEPTSEPATQATQSETRLQRTASSEQPVAATSSAQPVLKRATERPAEVPAAAANVAQANAQTRQSDSQELSPQSPAVARATHSPLTHDEPTVEPTPPAPSSAVAQPSPSRATASAPAPAVAQSAPPTPSRTRAETSAPTTAQSNAAQSAEPAPSSQPNLSPTQTQTARSTSPAPTPIASTSQPADTPSPLPPSNVAASSAQRASASAANAPAQNAPAAAAQAVARANTSAASAPTNAVASTAPASSADNPDSSNAQLRPSQSSVVRNAGSASAPAQAASQSSPQPAMSTSSQLARAATARANSAADAPSANNATAAAAAPARSRATASTPATAADASNVAAAAQAASSEAAIDASQMVVDRGTRGSAGVGASVNMQRNLPAADSPAQTASTAASRRAASQQDAPGPALSPSQAAQVARSRAQATAPSATVAATPNAVAPDSTGAATPSMIEASASAAAQRNVASAPLATVTAAAGAGEVDTGAVRTVSRSAASRGAGGGQPQVASGSPTEMIARANAGGAPDSHVQSTTLAESPTTALEGNASGPASADVQANAAASAVGRQESGGVTSATVASAATGPESEAAGSDQVAADASGRASREMLLPKLGRDGGPSAPAKGSTATFNAASTADAVQLAGDNPGTQRPGPAGSDLRASDNSAAAARADGGGPAGSLAAASGAGEGPAGLTGTVSATDGQRTSGGAGIATSAPGTSTRSIAKAQRGGVTDRAADSTLVANLPAAVGTNARSDGNPASGDGPAASSVATNRSEQDGAGSAAARLVAGQGPEASDGAEQLTSAASATRSTGGDRSMAMSAGSAASPLAKASRGATATSTKAETIELAGMPETDGAKSPGKSNGALDGLAATGTPRDASGARSGTALESIGAVAGESPSAAPAQGQIGQGLARRQTAAGEAAPALADAGLGGAPLRKASRTGLPSTQAEPLDELDLAAGGPVVGEQSDDITDALGPGAVSRQVSGGVLVIVRAEDGPGGLGDQEALTAGSLSQRAQTASNLVVPTTSRFNTRRAGADYRPDLRARATTPAFVGRKRGDRAGAEQFRGRPSAKTEKAIELGLEYLAKTQMPDGSWSLTSTKPGFENAGTGSIHSDAAATGLALMAFLGAGYDHYDDRYKKVVADGLDFLVRNQQENGDLYVNRSKFENDPARFYSHGIAAIALCEAYGMTSDVLLREPAQKALDFLQQQQSERLGGWRYKRLDEVKDDPRAIEESDTSVSGWALMALKSGELAGLDVDRKVYERVEVFLAKAQVSPRDASRYVYNPYSNRERSDPEQTARTMTSVGLLMRLYTGSNRDNDFMQRGANFLAGNLPSPEQRDTYYWYYATQVMFHMGGDYWKLWNDTLHPMLAASQIGEGKYAGSWNPSRDRWGTHGGRHYVTTLNLLSLEVYYRHLPIYDETKK